MRLRNTEIVLAIVDDARAGRQVVVVFEWLCERGIRVAQIVKSITSVRTQYSLAERKWKQTKVHYARRQGSMCVSENSPRVGQNLYSTSTIMDQLSHSPRFLLLSVDDQPISPAPEHPSSFAPGGQSTHRWQSFFRPSQQLARPV